MIVVKFKGGLGNQMLQYATYLALKKMYPTRKVTGDISHFNITKTHNGFELEDIFPIKLDIYIGEKRNNNTFTRYVYVIISKIFVSIFKINFLKKFKYIQDVNVFNTELFELSKNLNYYIDGYWGNPKYFEEVKDTLSSHFQFKVPLAEEEKKYKEKILTANSVSFHVRRGDYVKNPAGFVDLSITPYYSEALNYVKSKIQNPVFFIFSDDINWCKKNMQILHNEPNIQFVNSAQFSNSYRDMQLMSLCKHNIIANSTFSWWSATLNKNPEKIVICPASIVYDKKKNDEILQEFYVKNWIKI